MDIATVIGILLGLTLVCGAIMLQTSIATFIDPASMAIVAGGTVSAVLMAFPLSHVFKILAVVRNAFFSKPSDPVHNVTTLVGLAEHARREGILSLESKLSSGDFDEFLTRGLRMAIDGQEAVVIEAAMEKEVESLVERHTTGKLLFDKIAAYAPAFGMIGTLIGLVIMLQNMDDPSKLGPSMAVALITTFYGSLIANLFATPIADKLALRSEQELAEKLLTIRGVMSIQAGDNPRVVQQKLMAFLTAAQRRVAEQNQER